MREAKRISLVRDGEKLREVWHDRYELFILVAFSGTLSG